MDHLGSTRLVTDANANVVTRHDFLPFGEELPPGYAGRNGQWAPGGDNVDQKFTGQIRDQETGLDYFNARYFGAALGRFTSPDPGNAGADPMDPQSWNAYAYALNNPLVTVDPSGTDPSDDGGDDPCFWNPFLCGFSPLPPPIFVGSGGGRNHGTSSGQPVDKTPLPPNSFPGGETLGLPPGMSVPNPLSAQVLLGLWSWDCSTGVCVPGVGGFDFSPANNSIVNPCPVSPTTPYGPCIPPDAYDPLLNWLKVRNWGKASMYAACLANVEPSYMTPFGSSGTTGCFRFASGNPRENCPLRTWSGATKRGPSSSEPLRQLSHSRNCR